MVHSAVHFITEYYAFVPSLTVNQFEEVYASFWCSILSAASCYYRTHIVFPVQTVQCYLCHI